VKIRSVRQQTDGSPVAEVDIAPLFGTPANSESPFYGYPIKKIDTTLFYSDYLKRMDVQILN